MKRALAALTLGACALLPAADAAAYVRTTTDSGLPMFWQNPAIQVLIYAVDPPRYLTRESLMQASRAGAAVWVQPAVACTSAVLDVQEWNEAVAPVSYDGVNRIGFRRDQWRKMPCDPSMEKCDLYNPGAIALTSVFANKKTGQILDADMEINAVTYKFADVVLDGKNHTDNMMHDLQNTLAHEFGHLLGFDHNCYDPASNLHGVPKDNKGQPVVDCVNAPALTRAATMFASASEREINKRDLAADDLLAVCETYPLDYGSSQGGCAVVASAGRGSRGERQGSNGALGLLALAGLGLLIARRRG